MVGAGHKVVCHTNTALRLSLSVNAAIMSFWKCDRNRLTSKPTLFAYALHKQLQNWYITSEDRSLLHSA